MSEVMLGAISAAPTAPDHIPLLKKVPGRFFSDGSVLPSVFYRGS